MKLQIGQVIKIQSWLYSTFIDILLADELYRRPAFHQKAMSYRDGLIIVEGLRARI
jgi:hypothetical protein